MKLYNILMETLFDDKFINKKVLERLIKEIKEEQISKTVRTIDYYNEIREKVNRKYDFSPSQNIDLEMLKSDNYAKRDLQA